MTLANSAVAPADNVIIYAVLLDKAGNAVDFSRTIVDEIPGGGTALAPFTWPASHGGAVVSIKVLSVAE